MHIRLGTLPIYSTTAITLAAWAATSGCSEEERQYVANLSEPETMPTMLTEDVLTLVSDSGYTRYRMTAPLWLMFDEAADPHWTFPQGVTVQQFDEQFRPSASMDCDSATYYSDRKIWEFEGDVVVINTLGDSILTQQLFWDVNDQKIYNDDEFIHIVRQDRIIEGYGFESNQDVTRFKVKRPQLIIPIRNLRRGDTDQQAHAQNLEPVQDTITDMDRRRRHGAPVRASQRARTRDTQTEEDTPFRPEQPARLPLRPEPN